MIRRQRGTGRIFLPKGSSVWWLQYYQNGVKRRESAETSNRREALEKLKLRIAELTTGSVTGLTPKKTRISELAEARSRLSVFMLRESHGRDEGEPPPKRSAIKSLHKKSRIGAFLKSKRPCVRNNNT